MSQQIAQVPTAVMVNGVRTIIAPGRPIPASSGATPAEPAAAPQAPEPKPESETQSPGDKPGRKAPGA